MKLIYIEWCDAMSSQTTWMSLEEAIEWADNKNWVVSSGGYLIKETDEYLLISREICTYDKDDTQLGGVLKIPKTWIRKRIDLTKHIK